MNELEKVRKEIAGDMGEFAYNAPRHLFTERQRGQAIKWANQILSIKGLRIEADNQEEELYPEVFATGLNLPSQSEMEMLRKFLDWLKHEGWVKCKVKEESNV